MCPPLAAWKVGRPVFVCSPLEIKVGGPVFVHGVTLCSILNMQLPVTQSMCIPIIPTVYIIMLYSVMSSLFLIKVYLYNTPTHQRIYQRKAPLIRGAICTVYNTPLQHLITQQLNNIAMHAKEVSTYLC